MYSVWLCDLEKALEVLKEKTHMLTFCSIEGNAHGDFIIKDGYCTYLVKHTDFSIWYREGDWKTGKWISVD